ncbi:hypothetical protein P171DRAFT_492252 [Karstenula rhodostoma CBS 690.94]|uniref:Zn(2)-C6 fungal-type domain-containing protein n=1 Tax=Karstenula rhodostoma CBS 690.94 TaxID=1392251 RepID=A0A9P4U5M5_9PLEO|nr:hypothetical protein P171DRAFT_492252 [Karstenula rhodostoma CBS 690.94]
MKTAGDAANLIACLPCAKAKAKCDKRLPSCSRCLRKSIKCESRQPKRYPEAHRLPSRRVRAPSTVATLTATTSSSPTEHHDSAGGDPLHHFFPTASDAAMGWEEGFQWPLPLSGLDDNTGGLPVDLRDQTLLAGGDGAMAFDFPLDSAGMHPLSSNLPYGTYGTPTPSTPAQNSEHKPSVHSFSEENWPYFRCNPPNNQPANPRTGSTYLVRLEDTLNDQSVWTTTNGAKTYLQSPNHKSHLHIEPIQDGLRDKLMVISQGFLNRARDIHRSTRKDQYLGEALPSPAAGFTGFFILPPPTVLDCFLHTYASRVEQYLPFFPAATLSASQLVISNDENLSILLLLLMIAHGAMGSPLPEARHLANGLIETCRICMYDVIEKNVHMVSHPVMLRCALLYLNAAAWSGTKWHMTFAAAQIRMYLSMLRCSGLLDARDTHVEHMNSTPQAESSWRKWQMEEKHNRLIYCWVSLDQEVHLFQDRQQEFDVTDVNAPMPGSDKLWNASSLHVWQMIREEMHREHASNTERRDTRRSLATLYKQFMSNGLSDRGEMLSLVELRLLLHPLQALIHHINKSIVYFLHSNDKRFFQGLLTQLEEVQNRLKSWYVLASRSIQPSDAIHGCATMVIFHLISLNAITHFPDIERLARGDVPPAQFREVFWTGQRIRDETPQIWCHAGQVLRYFRNIPASERPYWWSASVYRVALCLWAVGLAARDDGRAPSAAEPVAVDKLPFDHSSLLKYLRYKHGRPVLSHRDGTAVWLDAPTDVVEHCIGVLGEHKPQSRLDEGISARLAGLVDRWKA